MRHVVGRNIAELDPDRLRVKAARYPRTVVDVGTGGGTALVRRARRDTESFFVGIDANSDRMREASHRAARPADRGGAPNTTFVAAAADDLPGQLTDFAHEVSVVLPWGSLMKGLLAVDPQMVARLTGLLHPGGRLELLLSVAEADVAADYPPLDEQAARDLAARYADLGLKVEEIRLADDPDIDRLGSSWGRRLGIPRNRQGWILKFGT